MLFHAVPCYLPKLGETATDTKHANFDWRMLEAMQVQYCELRISNETLSASHGKHGSSCKNMDIPCVPELSSCWETIPTMARDNDRPNYELHSLLIGILSSFSGHGEHVHRH
jgi:hypothetical protein